METVRSKYPEARVEGVLVEMMANGGYEVIVGMRRDPQFGPLMMFGMGGVFVEVLTDVAFRIAPVDRTDALEMIQETKAGQLLLGVRGQEAGDVESVAGCIEALSRLALDFPQIREVEINPLLVSTAGAVALDGRIILEQ
jgi:acetyltransferase